MSYIKYSFTGDGLRALWEPYYKTEWIIYPSGQVNMRTFKIEPGIDEETFLSNPHAKLGRNRRTIDEKKTFSVDPKAVQKLMCDIQNGMYNLHHMCDAYDSAKIILMGCGMIKLNPAPYCLYEFCLNLEHNNHPTKAF